MYYWHCILRLAVAGDAIWLACRSLWSRSHSGTVREFSPILHDHSSSASSLPQRER